MRLPTLPNPEPTSVTAVLLLGMHRSGTSALAGSFREAGLYMGDLLDNGFELNPRGLQEPPSLVFMHDNLLTENGGSWHEPPEEIVWGKLHNAVRDLFIESRRDKGIWGFKEPRTLLVSDGWIEVLESWTGVGIFRDPRSVAASINNRNGLEIEKAFAIWEAYNERLVALHDAYGVRILEYCWDEDYLREAIRSAIRATGLVPPEKSLFLDMRHLRQRAAVTDLKMPDRVAKLYDALRERAGLGAAQSQASPLYKMPLSLVRKPTVPKATDEAMSTRLFPKFKGATAYAITGVAARCDWVFLTDKTPPQSALVRHKAGHPETVFLSLRNFSASLGQFCREVLPLLSKPVVLVSGSEDITLPIQTDKRWPIHTQSDLELVHDIAASELVKHWFLENLDSEFSPKVSPLPLGKVFPDEPQNTPFVLPETTPLQDRALKILCFHRVRDGAQWDIRRHVTQLAKTEWAAFCTVVEDDLPEKTFFDLVQEHAFVICAEGGGVDPAPKAWDTLIYGAIPIIRSRSLERAYSRLPVAQVADWQSDQLSLERLVSWRDDFASRIHSPEGREDLHRKLSLDYWWQQIRSALSET